jgi:3-dehydroquinate dehydratase-2
VIRIAVIHGPNLHLLGKREPGTYGATTLAEVDSELDSLAEELGVSLESFQSNHEGEIVDFIAAAYERGVNGFVVNPAAFTHTSVALRDAFLGVGLPFVEVHISNTAAREDFRSHSYLSSIAAGVVFGFGVHGYLLALRGLVGRLSRTT